MIFLLDMKFRFTCGESNLHLNVVKYQNMMTKIVVYLSWWWVGSLREKCPYSEFFWSVFSRIRTEYGQMLVSFRIHSECEKIRIRKTPNTDTFHTVGYFVEFLTSLKNYLGRPWKFTKFKFRYKICV